MNKIPDKKTKLRKLIALPLDQSDWEFTSVLISRPINFILLNLFGDFKLLTPNLVTIFGFFSFITASLILLFYPSQIILLSTLLFLRLILDDMDGMLARYRNKGSFLGSYLDKTTDVLGFFLYFTILGYSTYKFTGELIYLFIGEFIIFSLLTTGYVKWVSKSFGNDDNTYKPEKQFFATKPWWKVVAVLTFIKLPVINECDIFPISIVLLAVGKPHWLLWALAITQGLQMFAMIIIRGRNAWILDKNNKI